MFSGPWSENPFPISFSLWPISSNIYRLPKQNWGNKDFYKNFLIINTLELKIGEIYTYHTPFLILKELLMALDHQVHTID